MKARHHSTIRWSMFIVLALALVVDPAWIAAQGGDTVGSPLPVPGPTVSIRAASGATIAFTTHNGRTIGGFLPETRELPHFVLYRNGALSDLVERTLLVEVSGLKVPVNGLEVTLEVASMHRDPDRGDEDGRPIVMWRASRRIANTIGVTRTNVETTFVHTFGETVASGSRTIPTPTGYLRYRVTVSEAEEATHAAHELSQEYAALIENQWIVPLPEVAEAAPGAAPDELAVYYCEMIPFRRSVHEPASWLRRDERGFPWHEAWTNYRVGERLSVALTDGRTWYHTTAASALSLIITRLDTQEASDPVGRYAVVQYSDVRS